MGFISLVASDDLDELNKRPNELALLLLIARRSLRTASFSACNCNIKEGEVLISSYQACGLSEQEYRTAKKNLEQWNIIRTRRSNKGTVAKIVSNTIVSFHSSPTDQNTVYQRTKPQSINGPNHSLSTDRQRTKNPIKSGKKAGVSRLRQQSGNGPDRTRSTDQTAVDQQARPQPSNGSNHSQATDDWPEIPKNQIKSRSCTTLPGTVQTSQKSDPPPHPPLVQNISSIISPPNPPPRGQTGGVGNANQPESFPNDNMTVDDEFEIYWARYPYKVDKFKTKRVFLKFKKQKILPPMEVLLSALEAQKQSYQWQKEQGRYIPSPFNWIYGRKWEDQIKPEALGRYQHSRPLQNTGCKITITNVHAAKLWVSNAVSDQEHKVRKKFARTMIIIADNFRDTLTVFGLDARFAALRQFDQEAIDEAAQKIMATRKYTKMPTVADFFEALDAIPASSQDKALCAANLILAHLQASGKDIFPDLDHDPIAKELMRTRWPYHRWAEKVLDKDHTWWVKEFCASYKSSAADAPVLERITSTPGGKLLSMVDSIGEKIEE
ncbi:MAG: hypothetical protein GY874_14245 [Desulfobacteraceae bacterium]|nr:hypothetical protein [Desulfobacteraceae bacterium]